MSRKGFETLSVSVTTNLNTFYDLIKPHLPLWLIHFVVRSCFLYLLSFCEIFNYPLVSAISMHTKLLENEKLLQLIDNRYNNTISYLVQSV